MAIRNVGGTSVYVIDTPKPQTAKTSRGIGYGALVSHERWRLWEEIQKNEMTKLKFEQLGRESQLRVFEQQRRDLSRAIREAHKLKADVQAKRISPSAALARAKAQAQLDMQAAKANVAIAEKEAKASGVEVTEKEFLDIVGEPAIDPVTGQRLTLRTEKVRPGLDLPRVAAPRLPDVTAPGAQPEAIEAEDELDQLISSLEADLEGLEAPKFGEAPDVLERTRRGFERDIGVGGFGLAPRRLKTRPRFEEEPAMEQLQVLIEEKERDAIAAASQRKAETQRARAAEMEALGEPVSLVLDLTPEELAQARQEGRAAATAELRGAGALPAKPGQFLDIEKGGRLPAPGMKVPTVGGLPPADVRPGEMELEGQSGVAVRPGATGVPPEAAVTEPLPGLRLDGLRRPEAEALAVLGEKPEAAPFAVPPAAPMGVPADVARREPSPLVQPDFPMPSQRPLVSPELVAEARAFFKDADTGQPRFPGLEKRRLEAGKEPMLGNVPRRFDSDEEMVDAYLKAKQDMPAPVQETKAKPTRQQRRDRYAMNVLKKGAKLAEKPKKLERLAKTGLSTSQKRGKVPDYVILTDQLMDSNKKGDAGFQASYDELSRFYADKPEVREDAQAYLVAMSIMNEDISQPV